MWKKVGTISKEHKALVLNVEGWKLGRMVIGAENVVRLMKGAEVEINFVQNEFIGYAGRAKLSFSRKAVNIFPIDMDLITVPIYHVQDVRSGRREFAVLSQVKKDKKKEKAPIDGNLDHSF